MVTTQKIVNNIIGTKKYGGKKDLDGDGVKNKKDCQPRNVMRQDFNKTFYERKVVGDEYAKEKV